MGLQLQTGTFADADPLTGAREQAPRKRIVAISPAGMWKCECGLLPLRLDPELRDQRVFVRKLVRLEFGINESAIHVYIEDAACAPYQGRLHAERIFELGSETRRRG
jgi:hypothetical protein